MQPTHPRSQVRTITLYERRVRCETWPANTDHYVCELTPFGAPEGEPLLARGEGRDRLEAEQRAMLTAARRLEPDIRPPRLPARESSSFQRTLQRLQDIMDAIEEDSTLIP